jgi:transcription initiation factor TFIID subunit 1
MSQSGDSDSSDENETDRQKGLNLAGFLFGNIGEDGQLEDSFLDEASKRKLGGLNQILGLANLIQDDDLVRRTT